ncbi:MAG: hypothetical protein NT178_04065 [Proteobacteria bacterium]|nr:hypothetical protein [Pseudomonadota bacterium]
MPLYAFMVHDACRIVDAFNLKDALQEACIKKGDEYEIIGEEDLEYMCFLSGGTGNMLFGS